MFGHSLIENSFRGAFASIASPDKWGRVGVEFHTLTGWKTSRETTNTMILITDGVGERDLGLVTVFCHPYQAKMEACDTLSALHQCNTSEPSVVAVRRYPNTLYIPLFTPFGCEHFLWGHYLSPIPIGQAVLVPCVRAQSFIHD